jgi:conjugal transfer/entry exclusion protein
MNNNLQFAIKCFDENLRLFADAHQQPEKYNLYQGLSSMAEALDQIEQQIQKLNQQIQFLQAHVR